MSLLYKNDSKIKYGIYANFLIACFSKERENAQCLDGWHTEWLEAIS